MLRRNQVICLVVIIGLVVTFSTSVFASEPEPRVSTLFFETDIRDAITELVLQTGVNIIVDDTVRGIVTLDLQDVPLEKVLTMMLLGGGYTFRKIDDYYFVGMADPRTLSFQHLVETETIKLQHITAEEARSLLPSIYDRYLKSADQRDMITISAPPNIIERFKEDLAQLDQPSKTVLIQAIVTEISQSALQEWGANLLQYSLDSGQQVTNDWQGSVGFAADIISLNTNIFGNLLKELRALEGEQKATIRANPRVVVDDRKTVNLFSGETQHLLLSDGSSGNNRSQTVDVGVSLEVTPRIVNDEEMQLTISPEISHLSGEGLDQNRFSVRRTAVSTSVYTVNGQTLLLAGLTLEQENSKDSHVPVLGKLPLVRWLFSQKSEAKEEREMLIFITAEIQ